MAASHRSATLPPGVRPRTAALIATVAIAVVLVLTIVLSIAGGGDDERAPVHVVPSAPLPPSPAERDQPPGQWGPGMRP